MNGFEKAVLFFGNKYRMAKKLGVSPMRVQQWGKRRIPTEWAIKISDSTGIPRAEIRPDIFGDAA